MNNQSIPRKPKKLSQWLEELTPTQYKKAMDNVRSQNMEDRLNWSFEGGITTLTLAFDFRTSLEGRSYWMEVMEETFEPVF